MSEEDTVGTKRVIELEERPEKVAKTEESQILNESNTGLKEESEKKKASKLPKRKYALLIGFCGIQYQGMQM